MSLSNIQGYTEHQAFFVLWGLQAWCLGADHHSFLRKIRKLSVITWGFLLYPFPKHYFCVCVLTHV